MEAIVRSKYKNMERVYANGTQGFILEELHVSKMRCCGKPKGMHEQNFTISSSSSGFTKLNMTLG